MAEKREFKDSHKELVDEVAALLAIFSADLVLPTSKKDVLSIRAARKRDREAQEKEEKAMKKAAEKKKKDDQKAAEKKEKDEQKAAEKKENVEKKAAEKKERQQKKADKENEEKKVVKRKKKSTKKRKRTVLTDLTNTDRAKQQNTTKYCWCRQDIDCDFLECSKGSHCQGWVHFKCEKINQDEYEADQKRTKELHVCRMCPPIDSEPDTKCSCGEEAPDDFFCDKCHRHMHSECGGLRQRICARIRRCRSCCNLPPFRE
jgi:hypothetical protein